VRLSRAKIFESPIGCLTGISKRCYNGADRPERCCMAIDPQLLEILACPLCKTEVTLTADSTGLLCRSCRRRYPIVDDIPVMLVEEATVVPEEPR